MPPIETAPDDGDLMQLAETAQNALQAKDDPLTKTLQAVSTQTANMLRLAALGRELNARYKDVAFDVSTGKGMDEATAARLKLRAEVRYPMQKLKDERSKILGSMQRQANASADELIAEVLSYEKPIDDQIKAEEQRKDAERAEREAAETARRDKHIQSIAAITGIAATAVGQDAIALGLVLQAVHAINVDARYEEFEGAARQAKDEAIRQIEALHAAALQSEAQARDMAAEKQRQEEERQRLAAQAAELQRDREKLDAQVAAMNAQREQQERAQQERAQAVYGRITALRTFGAGLSELTPSKEILAKVEELRAQVITEALFDDEVENAKLIQRMVGDKLLALAGAATIREAEKAVAAQAAAAQKVLDDIRALTTGPADTSDDIEAAIQFLRGLNFAESCGDREDEANAARAEMLLALDAALQDAKAREAAEAEQAETARIERAKVEAECARIARMHEKAPQMFDVLRRLVSLNTMMADGIGQETPETVEARTLLMQIDPNIIFED